MAAKAGGDSDTISDINVTPLVDIMLVLVIILMISAEFTKYKTIPIKLPNVNAAAVKKEPQRVVLTVKPDGSVYWAKKKIKDLSTLPGRLKKKKKSSPDVALILRAESKTEYGTLLGVLDEVKLAGISKVGLAVDSNKKNRR